MENGGMGLFKCKEENESPTYLDSVEDRGDYFMVRLKGVISSRALQTERHKMTAVIEKHDLYGKDILCDLGAVTETDSATVATLIQRLADARPRNHKLIFFNLPKRLSTMMEITKVLPLFSIKSTEAEALAELN